MNPTRCIITSASDKFFPSLLNLIGSLKEKYPDHPHVYVYDLGISAILKRDIEKIDRVSIIPMPRFVPFWRSCYTWKTHILNTPLEDLNFYIDAGCQILRPLDSVFEKIQRQGYLLVSQGKEVRARDITPHEYASIFDISEEMLGREIIAAGIFGFSRGSEKIRAVTQKLYDAAVSGLCLGFSTKDHWKNHGKNRSMFVRNCDLFRHDTTLLTLLVMKGMDEPAIEEIDLFEGNRTGNPEQLIWNVRMNYTSLECANIIKVSFPARAFLSMFMKTKKLKAWMRK